MPIMSRRSLGRLLALGFSTLALVGLHAGPVRAADPPIIFVHGNGDTAALWNTIIWRFESNGYDRKLLHAIDFSNPTAPGDDTKPQPGRSTAADQLKELAAFVQKVQSETGQQKVALVGSSRGGNAIRNYLKNGGGAANVSHAVLGGTPNHGVFDWEQTRASEFNGKGAFLTQLNAGETEVVLGVRFMTTRSDRNDLYAQPDGAFLGAPGRPTGVTFEGPALNGAENVVLPGLDHREVAFHPLAFKEMYRFITGREPASREITAETAPVLNGKVSGRLAGTPTNLPVEKAEVQIFQVAPGTGQRMGGPVHVKVTSADGLWGPFTARPDAWYEFVLSIPDGPVTHIYRSPFPRSSNVVHLRPGVLADADKQAGSVVTLTRPRGYFMQGRDTIMLDGKPGPGIKEGVASVSSSKLTLEPGAPRPVLVQFNDERLTVLSWPAQDNHVVIAELHY